MRSFGAVVVLAVALLAPPAAVSAEGPGGDPIQARAFAVRFRSIDDAQALVTPLLSPEGSVTVQPRMKTLVVQDRASIVERIGGLLRGFDLPPRNVEVTLSLFLGTDRREREAGREAPAESPSREVRGISETLGDFTRWNSYQHLGGRSVTGAEGSTVTVDLSDEYRAVFEIDAVLPQGDVRLRRFTLQRLSRSQDGGEKAQEVYTTELVLTPGRMLMVGAAQNPESKRALFLSLQARPR